MKLYRIYYNGGEIWVDKSEDFPIMKKGQLFFRPIHNIIDTCIHNEQVFEKEYPIVAQSITNPSYIDGVPFVEVWQQVDELKIHLDFLNHMEKYNPVYGWNGYYEHGWKNAKREAAQAKQFTEEDIRKALSIYEDSAFILEDRHHYTMDTVKYKKTIKEVINSLKPKVSSIEIEMITEWWDNNLNCWVGAEDDDTQHSREVPKTYQKDGKTFLKVKSRT